MTHDLIHNVHERHRHSIFQFYPSQAVMKAMLDKAVLSHEKQMIKRKETVSQEAKRSAQQAQ